MNTNRNQDHEIPHDLSEKLKDFQDHCRKFESALDQVNNRFKQLAAQDVMSNTASPYLFFMEAVSLGFYLRDKVHHLAQSAEAQSSSKSE